MEQRANHAGPVCRQNLRLPTVFAVAFTCGLLLENIAARVIAVGTSSELYSTVVGCVDSECQRTWRAEAFYDSFVSRYVDQGIARSLFLLPESMRDLEKCKKQLPSSESEVACHKVAQEVYYNAKNVVYLKQNYFTELKSIESRVKFSESLCALVLLATPLAIYGWVRILRREGKTSRSRLLFLGVWFLAFLAVAHTAAWLAFQSEEKAFANRVFGYHITLATNGLVGTRANKAMQPTGEDAGG